MIALEVLFWIAAGLVAYVWVGYPAVLALLAPRGPRHRPLAPGTWPRLSVVVAAHDEAAVIRAKVESALRQRYPAERLEVIVVSDGSTDGTDEIVQRIADRRVRLVRQEPRAGKSAALNRGVAVATGDVLVFTDANALFAPEALARLAAPFADPRVGLVSGVGGYAAGGSDAAVAGSGYVRWETFVKTREGRLGFLASADGAIYAVRRALFRPLGPAEVDDLVHPIRAALEGFRCRFDRFARTVEPPSTGAGAEFRRQVRIVAQGYHLLWTWLPRLVAARRWRAVWMLASHRLLRWTGALWLTLALAASAALAGRGRFYAITLVLQLAFYGLAAAGALAGRAGTPLGRAALPAYFCVVHLAGALGLVRWLRGRADATWAPRGQVRVRDRAA